MRVFELGCVPYATALELQMRHVDEVIAGASPVLLLLEHPPVITLGRNGRADSVLVAEDQLRAQGIAVHRSTRGGDATCHFPGQLVAYAIFRLDRRAGGIHRFFYDIEAVILRTLEHWNIEAGRRAGRPGVWVEGRKIASIGIGARRWVSFHGLALNVSHDLGPFALIAPCGMRDVEPTSMERELERRGQRRAVALAEVKARLTSCFAAVFEPVESCVTHALPPESPTAAQRLAPCAPRRGPAVRAHAPALAVNSPAGQAAR